MVHQHLREKLTLAIVFCLVCSLPAEACSRILWNTSKNGVFVSRSMDWHETVNPGLRIFHEGLASKGGVDDHAASWISRHGSAIIVGTNYADVAVDGVNEKGLGAHLLYLDGVVYGDRDSRPGVSYLNWLRFVLDNYSTVEEAVKGIAQIQIVPVPIRGQIYGVHLAIEDASGDSAIFEHLDGKLVVHHGRQYVVMCNEPSYDQQLKLVKDYKGLGGDAELPGGVESPDRFVRASYFLKYLPEPKDEIAGVASVFQLIRNVAVPYGAPYKTGAGAGIYPTCWVTAIDLENKVYYFNSTMSPNVVWVELDEVNLSRGRPVQSLDLDNPALVGDVSALVK